MAREYTGIKYAPFYFSYYTSVKKMDPVKRCIFEDAIYDFFFFDRPLEETTGDESVDLMINLISGFLESSKKDFVNGKKGGRPGKNEEGVKTPVKTPVFENENPPVTPVYESENPGLNGTKPKKEKENKKENNKEKENKNNNRISLSEVSIVLEPFFDEKKQRSYSGRIDRPDVFKVTLEEWYEMDRDVLIDGMYSVHEYVESYQKYKGYPFEYNLPGTWDRKMVQLFREAMHEEFGDDISVSFRWLINGFLGFQKQPILDRFLFVANKV